MPEENNKQHQQLNKAGLMGINEPPIIFAATDPLGRSVILKQTTWNMHIINGDNYRPELEGQEVKIKDVVEDPKFIVEDPIDNRERYYDLVYLTSINQFKPVMVVVDHSHSTGDICTVFVQSRLRNEPGERGIIYERPKR